MILLAVGILLSSAVPWVAAQGAQLTSVDCPNSPVAEGGALHLSFKLTGSPPADASNLVSIYKDGEDNAPVCSVDRQVPCTPAASCGCSETGGERTFHYSVSSANASQHDGNWTAVLPSANPADTVRSPVRKITVTAQGGFESEYCGNSPCENGMLRMSFKFSGALPPNASDDVVLYRKDGCLVAPFCSVSRTVACGPLVNGCHCTEAAGERTYHLYVTSANSVSHDGDWTAVLVAGDPAHTVRSPVCRVKVNYSCPSLATDHCPQTVNEDEPFYISFVQAKPFPSTAGSLLTILNEDTGAIGATINLTLGVQQVIPAGSYERDGDMVFYLNLTGASEVHAGGWIAFVANDSGTIQSDRCQVAVGDGEAYHSGRTLTIILAFSCVFVTAMFVLSFFIENTLLLLRTTCVVSALFCLIPAAEINLQVLDIIGKNYADLQDASIAFVVIGSVVILALIVVTVVFFIKQRRS